MQPTAVCKLPKRWRTPPCHSHLHCSGQGLGYPTSANPASICCVSRHHRLSPLVEFIRKAGGISQASLCHRQQKFHVFLSKGWKIMGKCYRTMNALHWFSVITIVRRNAASCELWLAAPAWPCSSWLRGPYAQMWQAHIWVWATGNTGTRTHGIKNTGIFRASEALELNFTFCL